MRKESGFFFSTNKVNNIAYSIYYPETTPKMILQVSHGMCEYLDRYEPFFSYLTEKGIICCGNDHIGHGKSVSSREELGFFPQEEGYKYLSKDLYKLTRYMKERYPYLPYTLLGHSMGTFVLRDYLSQYGYALTSAILCGTSGKNPFVNMGIILSRLIGGSKGKTERSPFLSKIAFGSYNSRFPEKRTEYDWLTKEENIVDRYIKDPYCHFNFTVNGYENLFSLLKQVSSSSCMAAYPKDLPIILLSGEMDPVGNYGKGVQEVYRSLRKAGIKDVTLKLYPNDRHEILNETDRFQVYEDIFRFLQEKNHLE